MQQSSLIDVWQGSKYVSGLNFTSRTKTLLNETVEYAELTKFQNYNGKISQAQLINTFSFPGSPLNTKKTPFFSKTPPGRSLLKLIYWNKSMQITNIITTTNEQPGTNLNKDRKIPKKTAVRRRAYYEIQSMWRTDKRYFPIHLK